MIRIRKAPYPSAGLFISTLRVFYFEECLLLDLSVPTRCAFNSHGADIEIRDCGKRDMPPHHRGLKQAAAIGFFLLALLGVLMSEAIFELANYEGKKAGFMPCPHGFSHIGFCGH